MRTPRFIAAALVATVATAPVLAQELESDMDRLSYTVGMDIGNSLSDQGLELNLDLLVEALRATYNGEETRLTPEEALAERDAFMQRRQQELADQRAQDAARNLEEGQAFLAQNREREGVMETESGLQYRVIEEGEGASPAATDTVTVHYRGSLLNGTEFDSSYNRGQPATFALNQVIPGWTEGVQLMSEGAKYEFFIPSDLAYGEQGRPGPIGPNSTLIFEVELISVDSGD
ncbi:FKBP-type peptidyl-prolyl cis-trans isomerase [Wenzhouxiangella marina]|uniref:Peptidyl-prolyl cis-trans isomerase n=1 Tax=Wenzhouxiangella marina TaxID=1579979 RepID=A0A0K0XXA7_9GAMM|nr:FKBP-type peptidyl-prolyl cis-trans isomerase [Wenzhouxiangella marina]AKS42318.1 membrane protein [Wenzhouxiangella marina]MBB6085909.1 FKBP-type peptidyl-prolyl cis-trans isomerase [Wenzhouxiangella marina]